MEPDDGVLGLRPPRQARSRETLQKLLNAAEEELASVGGEEITMIGVAARAGVSVGTVYRRFDGKEQLLRAVKDRILARLVESLAARLATSGGDLAAVVDTFTRAIVDWAAESGRLLSELVGSRHTVSTTQRQHDDGGGIPALRQLFVDAGCAHRHEVRRRDPEIALAFVARTVSGSATHRALSIGHTPDGLTWAQWQRETADMVLVYLTHPERDDPCA